MTLTIPGQSTAQEALDFVLRERRSCLSDREWQHRLMGYGYAIRDTARGRVLTTVTGGVDLCALEG